MSSFSIVFIKNGTPVSDADVVAEVQPFAEKGFIAEPLVELQKLAKLYCNIHMATPLAASERLRVVCYYLVALGYDWRHDGAEKFACCIINEK